MTKQITYAEVNAKGRENLIEYLRDWLKEPETAERHADYLIDAMDGSDPEVRTISVEVRGMDTVANNPMTYSFGRDELGYGTIDDDGHEVDRS